MKRGELVTVVLQGDYGKPRPAVIVQSDLFNETHASVTIAPVTTTLLDAPLFRLAVEPSATNGLRSVSQIMIDEMTSVRRDRIGEVIGTLDDETLVRVGRAIALWLGVVA